MVAGLVFNWNGWGKLLFLLLPLLLIGCLACNNKNISKGKNGLVGDGKADDTAALQKLLQRGGKITLPAGTYRISSTIRVNPEILEVSAEGATLIAAPRSTYNLISVQAPNKRFIWKGGTFDGNKDQQVYPGQPNRSFEGKWQQTVTNNGIVGNQNFEAEYALLEDVVLKNFVSDGSCLRADVAEFRNCKAYDSAFPRDKYPQAFKFRSDGIPVNQKREFFLENCRAENVYIGFGVAAKDVGQQTYLEIDGFESTRTGKSSIHLEHIAFADIKNINCRADGKDFSSRIHIGNQNREFRLNDFEMEGGFIRGAKKSTVMEITNGKMSNTQQFDYAIRQGPKTSTGLVQNVIVEGCKGGIKASQIKACEVRNAQACAFENARVLENSKAERAAVGALNCKEIRQTTFSNTQKGVHQVRGRQQVVDCQFKQCKKPILVEGKAQSLTVNNSEFADWDTNSIEVKVAGKVNIKGNKFVQNSSKGRSAKNSLSNKAKAIKIATPATTQVSIENNEIEGLAKPFAVPQINAQKLKKQNTIRQ